MKSHVSFSEINVYYQCRYRHYIEYILEHKSPDTVYSVFGNLVHKAIDVAFKTKSKNSWIGMGKGIIKWIKENPEDKYAGELDYKAWTRQAFRIYNEIFDWLEEKFPEYKLIESELELYEPIGNGTFLNFKGFIDLVIKDKDGIYHVIDFKTCSWGWDRYKRSDTHKQYQISLYKKYFCQRNEIDPKNVKTHFVLLKRTPPKNSKTAEIITITSGNKKLDNASNWMMKQINGIKKNIRIKNRINCKLCSWHHTGLCP